MLGFIRDETAHSMSFYPEEGTVSFGAKEVEELTSLAKCEGNGVARVALHKSPTESLHSMLIAQVAGRYWRPKRHLTKFKSFHIVEGTMLVILFDKEGEIVVGETLSVDDRRSVFVPAGTFHTNLAVSAVAVHHEVIEGPFTHGEVDREAAWFAPPESDKTASAAYVSMLLTHHGLHAEVNEQSISRPS